MQEFEKPLIAVSCKERQGACQPPELLHLYRQRRRIMDEEDVVVAPSCLGA